MFHQSLLITPVSYILPYRPVISWLSKKLERREQESSPPASRGKISLAASTFRACRRWLAAWFVLHALIVLSLVRGISSGGGVFAPELDKIQVKFRKYACWRDHCNQPWAFPNAAKCAGDVPEAPVQSPNSNMGSHYTPPMPATTEPVPCSVWSEIRRRQTTMREETRPICPDHSLVSPADGTVLHVGKIVDGEVKQVKGVNYKLVDFLGATLLQKDLESDNSSGYESDGFDQENERGLPRNDSIMNLFRRFPHLKPSKGNELYHLVVYLSIVDCHHFHSPADWNVQIRRHIVGELLSVAPWVVKQVPDLFCLSERVVLGGYWEHGFFSLCAVGAYNVGSIEVDMDQVTLSISPPPPHNVGSIAVDMDQELATNSSGDENERGEACRGASYNRRFGSEGVPARKGEHMGLFNLGSTVVLVFEAPKSFEFSVKAGDRVKFGQPLGTMPTKMHSLEFYGE